MKVQWGSIAKGHMDDFAPPSLRVFVAFALHVCTSFKGLASLSSLQLRHGDVNRTLGIYRVVGSVFHVALCPVSRRIWFDWRINHVPNNLIKLVSSFPVVQLVLLPDGTRMDCSYCFC